MTQFYSGNWGLVTLEMMKTRIKHNVHEFHTFVSGLVSVAGTGEGTFQYRPPILQIRYKWGKLEKRENLGGSGLTLFMSNQTPLLLHTPLTH